MKVENTLKQYTYDEKTFSERMVLGIFWARIMRPNSIHSRIFTSLQYFLTTTTTYRVSHNITYPSKELYSKMALGEVGV